MAQITFINADGSSKEVHVEAGTTVMQAAMDNGIDGIIAECGGACSCATCHVYVDESWLPKLEEPSSIEQDMIECVLEPEDNSRLSCQIVVSEDLDGLVVRVPESQY
jgi:2Fe-2S ferredoxin